MTLLGWTGLVFLYAVFTVIGVPALLGDYLFYRSDIFSFCVLVAAAAILLFPLAGFVGFVVSRLQGRAKAIAGRWAAYIAAVGIIDIFLGFSLLYLVALVNMKWLNHLIKHPVIAMVVCLLPAVLIVYVQADKSGLISRIKHIGILAMFAAPLLVAYSILSPRLASAGQTAGVPEAKHLLLIVLDGWASQTLHFYNEEAPRTAFDDTVENARIFLGAYTSAAWTSAYFGTLYNGNARVVGGDKRKRLESGSLAAQLQVRNVDVRLMNFHRNGIPDASAAHRSDHTGLRSYYLTERYYWIPHALGLEYHIALSGSSIKKNFGWSGSKWLFTAANPLAHNDRENALIEVLLPELRRLREDGRSTFMLFHVASTDLGNNASVDLSDVPGAQEMANEKRGKFPTPRVRANDYRYEPSLEPLVAAIRQKEIKSTLQQGVYLKDFMDALKADPAFANTVVVMTADHGRIYGKGRMWYGYHPNREVTRVPFIVFDGQGAARDGQIFATPRLSRAIMNYFLPDRPATSFMTEDAAAAPAFSMTLKGNVTKEWMLAANYDGKAYWMNLHPDGNGKTLKMKNDGYQQSQIASFDGPPPELESRMQNVLQSFGLEPEDLHAAFR